MKLLYSFDELYEIGNRIKLMPMSDEGYYYLADKLFEIDDWSNMYDIDNHQIVEINSIKYVMLSLLDRN